MFYNEVGACKLVRFQIFALTLVCCFLIQKYMALCEWGNYNAMGLKNEILSYSQ
jgi:hypothetical protein